MKKGKNHICLVVIFLTSALTTGLFAQSGLVISSSDSINFSLRLNDKLETDSLVKTAEFYFPLQSKVFCQVLDGAQTEILSKEIKLHPNKIQKLDLRKVSGEWILLPVSEFEISSAYLNYLEVDSLIENTEIIIENKPLIIRSSFKTSFNPNKKEISELQNLVFEKDKLTAIEKLIKTNSLSKNELITLLNIISYEDKRLEIITEFNSTLKDVLNSDDIEHLFKLDRYKDKALESLGL